MGNPTKGLKRIQMVSVQMVKEKNLYYDSKTVRSPEDGAKIIREFIGGADREMLVVACLTTKNQIASLSVVSMGNLSSSIVHPREVFKTAILSNSASIIIGHNHPSGDVTPSGEDIEVTKRLAEASKILGIELLDHLIVGDNGKYYSLKESNHF